MGNDEEWVELTQYSSLVEAELAKTKLDSFGIDSYITKDDAGGMNPMLQFSRGVRIFVAKSSRDDAAQALELEEAEGDGDTDPAS
ncbi:MAG TPA: hypothetical protein VFG11_11345 [Acidobacteriota bacterium]|nr:hypothetical protein [Acidobacteriota bacterium]